MFVFEKESIVIVKKNFKSNSDYGNIKKLTNDCDVQNLQEDSLETEPCLTILN